MSVRSAATRSADRRAVTTWMRLARVYQKVNRESAARLRPHDLSLAQFDVLAQVGAHEGMTQQQLANKLLVTKGNVCQVLDRMEARDLVRRQPLATGRGNLLYLTESGWDLRERLLPGHEAQIAARFDHVSSQEREQLSRLLRKLDRATEHDDQEFERERS